MITIYISPEKWEVFGRSPGRLENPGGFQRLLYDLHLKCKWLPCGGRSLTLTRQEAERVRAYADPKYGEGTYQRQYRAIEPDVSRELDNLPPPPQQFDLFSEEVAA